MGWAVLVPVAMTSAAALAVTWSHGAGGNQPSASTYQWSARTDSALIGFDASRHEISGDFGRVPEKHQQNALGHRVQVPACPIFSANRLNRLVHYDGQEARVALSTTRRYAVVPYEVSTRIFPVSGCSSLEVRRRPEARLRRQVPSAYRSAFELADVRAVCGPGRLPCDPIQRGAER